MAQSADNWECRLDTAGRRRYYLNDKFVPAKAVPVDILGKLECTVGAKSPSKKMPSKTPSKREIPKVPQQIRTYKSYIDILPLDLVRSLMSYFTGKQLQKLCDVESLRRVCEDDEFWHKLVLTHLTSKPDAKVHGKKWKGWREFYIKTDKLIDHKKPIEKQIAALINNNLTKLIASYIGDITDPELLYAILVETYRFVDPDFAVIKKLIIDKKVNWPDMYQRGKKTGVWRWESLSNKYDLYLPTQTIPAHGNYPVEIAEYLLSFMPNNYPYRREILQELMKEAIVQENAPLVQYILDTYIDVAFDFSAVESLVYHRKSDKIIQVLKVLKDHGVNLHANNDELLVNAAFYNNLDIIKYLTEQGADIHTENESLLRTAAQRGHLDIVKYLVEHGADIHVDDDAPLAIAVNRLTYSDTGTKGVVRYLLKMGASTDNLDERQKEALKKV